MITIDVTFTECIVETALDEEEFDFMRPVSLYDSLDFNFV